MKKFLAILAAGLMTVSSATMFNAQSASAAGHRADVDMIAACLYQYQGAWKADVVIAEWNVMGWKCYLNGIKVPVANMLDIDVKSWCRHQYRGGVAKYDDFNNPYSWYCEY